MAKWSYKVRSFAITERWSSKKQAEEIERLEGDLNAMGGEGWELVGVHSFRLVGGVLGGDKGEAAVTLWKQAHD